MELVGPANKRIKLEHSYAAMNHSCLMDCSRIKEEDPLKISFEDTTIKTENEDGVVVKKEASESTEPSQSFEYFNFPSISQEFENHSPSESDTLVADESVRSNNERDCLELINNCDIIKNVEDPLILVDKFDEAVPKLIFLEFLKNYENTIKDLKSQNEKLINEAAMLSNGNNPVLPEDHKNDPLSTSRCPSKWELQLEVKKLRQELKASRAQEKMLEMRANMRQQGEATVRKSNSLLRKQFNDVVKTKEVYIEEINQLNKQLKIKEAARKRLTAQLKSLDGKTKDHLQYISDLKTKLVAKETQFKEYDKKCCSLSHKLTEIGKQYANQQAELSKTKHDLTSTEKALADSDRIRQILTERSIRLDKELQETKRNPSYKIKLQETHKELVKSVQRAAELEKLLNAERNKSGYLVKERDQLLEEQQIKFKTVQRDLIQVKQSLSASRTLLGRKMDQCRSLREEIGKLTVEYNLKEAEVKKKEEEILKKDEAYRTKVCEYCGEQIEETFRRINAALQEQFGDNFNRAGCPEEITRLKRDLLLELQKIRQLEESQAASEVIKLRTQLSTKDAQCSSLTSELWKLSKEFDTQKADLFKATQNVVTLKKKLAESTIIRQTLKLHNVRLGKELKEWMVNPSVQDLRLLRKNLFDKNVMLENLKAQNVKLGIELQALRSNPSEGAKLRQTVAELQKSLDFEIANNTQLTIERDRLRAARQTTMYQEQSEKERQGLRTALRLEMEECKNLRERIKKLTEKYTPKEQEIEKARALLIGKEIAYKTKVCDYCGH